jgi:hypothetical protein
MVSKVGWVIASIVFLIFFYFMLNYIISQTRSYGYVAKASASRSFVQNVWTTLFTSPGIPENWEDIRIAVLPGLKTNLYKIPLVVNETSGSDRGWVTLNISLKLDNETCSKKIINSSVRVYEGDVELNSSLYNQTFCPNGYLNFTEVVFKANFSAYQSKTFFIFYSSEKVSQPTYSVNYPTSPETNFSYYLFSEEIVPMLSLSKLKAFENLSYQEIKVALGIPQEVNLEIDAANRTFPNHTFTPRTDVFYFSAPMLIQDEDGKIKYTISTVKLWR